MSNMIKKIESLFGTDIFNALQNSDIIDIAQLNAAIALLIKFNIPFSLTFQQGTNENVPVAKLTITLSPTTEITFLLPFARGPL